MVHLKLHKDKRMEQASQRIGNEYYVSKEDREFYKENGYLFLAEVIKEEELQELENVYDKFSSGSIEGMGRDFCDMSSRYDVDVKDFNLINAMLPRKYMPSLQGNIYEQLSGSISRQLLGDDMIYDYDQFLSKKPGKANAKFAMHQDMGYWPKDTPDTKTATCSLALTDSVRENGCICFVPGSHKSKALVPHRPAGESSTSNSNRDESHTLEIDMNGNEIVYVEVPRGSITVHDEWIIHGSGGNLSEHWRKTYIIAYRSKETVDYERSIGFTHSHNDKIDWKSALALT